MGIRFNCPNGHKLNVKAFQAGRKGFCPFCGARVQIPTESTRPEKPEKKTPAKPSTPQSAQPARPTVAVAPKSPGAAPALEPKPAATPWTSSVDSVQTGLGPDKPHASPASAAAPKSQPAFADPTVVVVGPSQSSQPSPMATRPAADAVFSPVSAAPVASQPASFGTAPPPAASQKSDPLAEAPEAVWYVRPPSGGQFGPAVASVMTTWIGEGRVSADSLVWREGWPDWQEAGKVFPQLSAPPPGMPGQPAPEAMPPAGPATPVLAAGQRSNSKTLQIVVIGVLVLIVIVLGVVFTYILLQGSEQPAEPADTPAPAATTWLLPASPGPVPASIHDRLA